MVMVTLAIPHPRARDARSEMDMGERGARDMPRRPPRYFEHAAPTSSATTALLVEHDLRSRATEPRDFLGACAGIPLAAGGAFQKNHRSERQIIVHTHRLVSALIVGVSLAGCAATQTENPDPSEETASQASALSEGELPYASCYAECRDSGGTLTSCKAQCRVKAPAPPPPTAGFVWSAVECTQGHFGNTGGLSWGEICDVEQSCTHFDGPCTGSSFSGPPRSTTQCVAGGGAVACTNGFNQFASIRLCADGSVTQSINFCL